ncbi:MAG: LPXTG cell wall anchor domain-containing protein [Renibacterium salmoninarum]|nr:LPXTG cell wall anchor domain-containing protein [Renibacterium salmoninarum]
MDAGDTVDYTFEVRNTGDVSISGATVKDPLIPGLTCPAGVLAPGQVKLCRATYTMTQADVDAGKIVNTATATGKDPKENEVTAKDTVTVTIPVDSMLDIIKTAGEPRLAEGQTQLGAGSLVDYTFEVFNDSNVTVTDVAIEDPTLNATITCEKTTLAPNESTTCKGTYTLTTADYDAGYVLNVADAVAKDPAGDAVESWPDAALVELKQISTMTMKKTAGEIQHQPNSEKTQAGDTVKYTFEVKNTGNTTLRLVGVRDNLVGTVKCKATTLAPGASTTCEATYSITQADIDRGTLENKATGVATPPSDEEISSPEDKATVDTKAESGLSLTKRAAAPKDTNENNRIDPGDTVEYTFTLTNSGQVTLTSLAVTDNQVATVTCPSGSLAPGATATCTATRTLTQADIDAGKVDNTATATATDAYDVTVTSNESKATATIAQQNTLSIKKSAGDWDDANKNKMMDPGETIPYSFRVTNTGTTTLSKVTVNDALISSITCDKTTLAPGDSASCTGTYTLTQADVDRGNVRNSATATGTGPGDTSTTSPGSEVNTVIPRTAGLTFDKQAGAVVHTDENTRTQAGDTITYTFVVKNSGNVSIDFLQINDPKVGLISCSKDVLGGGESMTCTKVYTITAADMDNGAVTNKAFARGEDPDGKRIDSNFDETSTALAATTELAIKKTAAAPKDVNENNLIDAGDTIDYSFAVTNNGTVTMSNLKVNDAKLPGTAISCPATSIAAGQTITCTGTYTITQADVDAGKAENTASVSGTPPNSTVAVTSGTSSTSTAITGSSSLTIGKTAAAPKDVNENDFIDAGDTIDYTFRVTNTGTTTLRSLVINDPLIPSANITCDVNQLAPKAATTCRGTYTITQSDVDSGKVVNTATATGKPDQGDAVTSPGSATETEISSVDKLEIVKSVVLDDGKVYTDANENGRPDAGEKIAYQFVVKNTGNTTQHDLRVADPKIANVSCPVSDLPGGASTTCTATYTMSQADIDAGNVENTATATGTPPGDRADISADSKVSTALDRGNKLTVVKVIRSVDDANENKLTDVPDVVKYTFTVTNVGNTTIKEIGIRDAKIPTVSCEKTELAPGAITTCTGSYTITQAEVNAGKVSNSATAVGTGPDSQETISDASTTELKTSATASMSLLKKVDPEASKATKAGDKISYVFTLRNTGTLTLSEASVAEQLPGVVVSCPSGSILPGQSVDCTGSYPVNQADVDNGKVTNTATAKATAPVPGTSDTQEVSTGQASVEETLTRNNQLGLSKVVKEVITDQPSGRPVAGDRIVYTLKATNQGNTTLTDVEITDDRFPDLKCSVASLAPGAELVCAEAETTYVVTQADADKPTLVNEAGAKATGPGNVAVDGGKQTTSTPTAQEAALEIRKSYQPLTDTNGDGVIGAGDKVTFDFVITNSGTVTLQGVEIDDQLALDAEPVCDATSLAPKASTNCTATYTLTQADAEAGKVENSATAMGEKLDGTGIESPASKVTVTIDRTTGLAFEKKIAGTQDVNADGRLAVGDQIDYVFTVRNTGNVKLTGVAVLDQMLVDAGVSISCPATELDPGQSIDCTAAYRISQSDANAGSVKNTAHAEAKQGETPVTSVESSKEQPLTVLDELSVDKKVTKTNDVNGNGKLDAGDTIEYQFLVTNSGTRDASGVSVNDPRVKVECPASVVGAGTSMTCTAVYTVTQADVDAGSLQNTATATGSTPDGKPNTSEPDSVTTPLDGAPRVKLLKQAGPVTDANGNGRKDAGDSIVYTFTVTNTGNTTLFGIVVQDEKLAAAGISVDCPVSQLAPGQSTTCTSAPYQVTAADVDAGAVSNVATARVSSGSNGGQKLTSDPASVKTGLDPKPTPPTPPVEPLPNTGVSNLWIIGLGALIIVIGAILLFLGARRRRRN